MGRGLPFVVTGFAFLFVALATFVTDGTSNATVWFSVGLALLAVGVGLSRGDRGSDDPEPVDGEHAETDPGRPT
jgi:hypothetical protein